jgi:tripartite-type tricarboxylate transporter receptor subunit TctC
MKHLAWASRLAVALMCGSAIAQAQTAAKFYKGKIVTIVVGSSSGGGYDTYARLLAKHLSNHIPGAPTVVVQNMPGAGSNIAATYVARIAPKDGTFIAAPYAAQPLEPILDDKANLNYDPSRVSYLGTAATDVFLCVERSNGPIARFSEAFDTSIAMGGTAANGATGYLPVLLDNVIGAKFKPVFGYPGTREITLAMEKGELAGMCGLNWTSINSEYADLYKTGKIKVLAQENATGVPELNRQGVPLTVSWAKTEEQKNILAIVYSQEFFARPYFMASDAPADRIEVMRRAFGETWKDPELRKEAAAMNLVVDSHSGEEVQNLLRQVYASPKQLLDAAKQAIKYKP